MRNCQGSAQSTHNRSQTAQAQAAICKRTAYAHPVEIQHGTAELYRKPRVTVKATYDASSSSICQRRVAIRGSANGRPPGFEPGCGGSNPSPRAFPRDLVSRTNTIPGQLLLVVTPWPRAPTRQRWSWRTLVRFQPRNLQVTEAIRPDEEPVLKTGGGQAPLVSSSLTASARDNIWAHRPTGRRQLRTLEIRVRFSVSPLTSRSRGPAATTPGLHPGNDGSIPSGTTELRIVDFGSRIEFPQTPIRNPQSEIRNGLSSWSSLECSPPCHGGDHGFKSRRGRLRHGTPTG
jgi:hypothetical protein